MTRSSMDSERQEMSFDEFRSMCNERRSQFLNYDIDHHLYYQFLIRNSFNASEAQQELAAVLEERRANAVQWALHRAERLGNPYIRHQQQISTEHKGNG